MKTVLITGASGFIARHLALVLRNEGRRVVGVSRRETPGFDKVVVSGLGQPLLPAFRGEQIEAVIHCANAVGEDEFRLNVEGTKRWLEEGEEHGVKLQILLSSLSARPDALSEYGRAKYALEKYFIEAGQVSFRPGLVIGNGGLFARMVESMRRIRVIPLLDNGSSKVHVTGIGALCCIVRDTINSNGMDLRGRTWSIQQPKAFTLREVMEGIRTAYGLKCLFVPVSSLLILRVLRIAEKLSFLHLPITGTNVEGLRQGSQIEHVCDYSRFGYPEESLEALIAKSTGDED